MLLYHNAEWAKKEIRLNCQNFAINYILLWCWPIPLCDAMVETVVPSCFIQKKNLLWHFLASFFFCVSTTPQLVLLLLLTEQITSYKFSYNLMGHQLVSQFTFWFQSTGFVSKLQKEKQYNIHMVWLGLHQQTFVRCKVFPNSFWDWRLLYVALFLFFFCSVFFSIFTGQYKSICFCFPLTCFLVKPCSCFLILKPLLNKPQENAARKSLERWLWFSCLMEGSQQLWSAQILRN